MENFAFSIMTATDGWVSLQQTKDQIERTLTDLIINAHPSAALKRGIMFHSKFQQVMFRLVLVVSGYLC